MKINYKVYKAKKGMKGNYCVAFLSENQKQMVIDETYEGENGNETYNKLLKEHPEIKNRWHIVRTRIA